MIHPNTQVIFTDQRRTLVVGRVIKGPDQVGQYAVEYGLGRWWCFLRERQMTPVQHMAHAEEPDDSGWENDHADSDL